MTPPVNPTPSSAPFLMGALGIEVASVAPVALIVGRRVRSNPMAEHSSTCQTSTCLLSVVESLASKESRSIEGYSVGRRPELKPARQIKSSLSLFFLSRFD